MEQIYPPPIYIVVVGVLIGGDVDLGIYDRMESKQ